MTVVAADLAVAFSTENLAPVQKAITGVDQQVEKLGRGFTDRLDSMSAAATKFGGVMTAAVTLPLVAIGKSAVTAASDLSEAMSAVNTVFGSASDTITTFADTSATALGISEEAALSAAGQLGALFSGLGLQEQQAADFSTQLLTTASDLGSFYNVEPGEAFTALRSGLIGEVEPLRRFGILLSAATVEQKALELGLAATKEEITDQDKVLARYELILDQVGAAGGDFARTSDGLANSQRILTAELTNLSAEFGEVLLPYAQEGVKIVRQLVAWFSRLEKPTKTLVIGIAAAAAAAGPLLLGLGGILKAVSLLTPALTLLTGPIGLVVAALAGLFFAYQTNFLGFADGVQGALDGLMGVFEDIGDAAGGFMDTFRSLTSQGFNPVEAALRSFNGVLRDLGLPDFSDELRGIIDAGRALGDWIRGSLLPVLGDLGDYFRIVATDGDFLNDFLGRLPAGIQPIVRWLGVLGSGLQRVAEAFGRDGLSGVVDEALSFIPTLIDEALRYAGSLAGLGGRLIGWIWDGIRDNAPKVWDWFTTDFLPGVADTLRGLWDRVENPLNFAFNRLQNEMERRWNYDVLPWLQSLPSLAADALSAGWDALTTAGGALLTKVKDGLVEKWPDIDAWLTTEGLPTIVETITVGAGQLVGAGFELIGSLLQGIVENRESIYAFFRDTLLPGIGVALAAGPVLLFKIGQGIVTGLLRGFQDIWNNQLSPWIKGVVAGIPGALGDLSTLLLGKGEEISDGLQQGMQQFYDNHIGPWLTGMQGRIVDGIGAANEWLVGRGLEIIAGLRAGIDEAWTGVAEWFAGIGGRFQAFFAGDGEAGAGEWLKVAGTEIVTGLGAGFDLAWQGVVGWMSGIKDRFTGFFVGASEWLVQAGTDIVGGLWSGISGSWDTLVMNFSGLINQLPFRAAEELEAESPSQVFVRIGSTIPSGLAVGIEQGMPEVLAALQSGLLRVAEDGSIVPASYYEDAGHQAGTAFGIGFEESVRNTLDYTMRTGNVWDSFDPGAGQTKEQWIAYHQALGSDMEWAYQQIGLSTGTAFGTSFTEAAQGAMGDSWKSWDDIHTGGSFQVPTNLLSHRTGIDPESGQWMFGYDEVAVRDSANRLVHYFAQVLGQGEWASDVLSEIPNGPLEDALVAIGQDMADGTFSGWQQYTAQYGEEIIARIARSFGETLQIFADLGADFGLTTGDSFNSALDATMQFPSLTAPAGGLTQPMSGGTTTIASAGPGGAFASSGGSYASVGGSGSDPAATPFNPVDAGAMFGSSFVDTVDRELRSGGIGSDWIGLSDPLGDISTILNRDLSALEENLVQKAARQGETAVNNLFAELQAGETFIRNAAGFIVNQFGGALFEDFSSASPGDRAFTERNRRFWAGSEDLVHRGGQFQATDDGRRSADEIRESWQAARTNEQASRTNREASNTINEAAREIRAAVAEFVSGQSFTFMLDGQEISVRVQRDLRNGLRKGFENARAGA